MDLPELPLTADMNALGAYAQAALRARKIESTSIELERLVRWLGRVQTTCVAWADASEAGADDFESALRDAARG